MMLCCHFAIFRDKNSQKMLENAEKYHENLQLEPNRNRTDDGGTEPKEPNRNFFG